MHFLRDARSGSAMLSDSFRNWNRDEIIRAMNAVASTTKSRSLKEDALAKRIQGDRLRDLLQAELSRRVSQNPQYSLRAFALFLGLESGHLARILSAKRNPTSEICERVCNRLGYTLAQLEASTSHLRKRSEFAELDPEKLKNWFHVTEMALFELAGGSDIDPQCYATAQRLSVGLQRLKQACENLSEAKLLSKVEAENGRILYQKARTQNIAVDAQAALTSFSRRQFQREVSELSRQAIDEVPIEFRDHSTLIVRTTPDQMELIRERIDAFRAEIFDLLKLTSEIPKDETILAVHVGVFPLLKQNLTDNVYSRAETEKTKTKIEVIKENLK